MVSRAIISIDAATILTNKHQNDENDENDESGVNLKNDQAKRNVKD